MTIIKVETRFLPQLQLLATELAKNDYLIASSFRLFLLSHQRKIQQYRNSNYFSSGVNFQLEITQKNIPRIISDFHAKDQK